MKRWLRHLFLPHHTNNYRAKLLHNQSLFILVILILVGQVALSHVKHSYGSVLGDATSITVQELLTLTNQQRQQHGLQPLHLDNELVTAAQKKGQNMFAENYWAHVAPDGTTPWSFIRGAGYDYEYAGENLARGFDSSQSVMDAWMASPGHRENILSANYHDVGFAIMSGNLTGEDTTLVVEEFGTRMAAADNTDETPVVPSPAVSLAPQNVLPTSSIPAGNSAEQAAPNIVTVEGTQSHPLLNLGGMSKNIALTILGGLMLLLLVDMIITQRKQISRLVAHSTHHILFFGILLILILVIGKGAIL